jgi:hypothetical protein
MTRDELLDCMREAAAALAELAAATPGGAEEQILKACRHVDQAIALLTHAGEASSFPRLAD